MRPKRNDIRTARKVIPECVNKELGEEPVATKRSGRLQNLSKATSNQINTKSRQRNVLSSSKLLTTDKDNFTTSEVDDEQSATRLDTHTLDSPLISLDNKRRRSGADSYIKKRFLYDVVEPPKRSKHKKSNVSRDRSTAALMAVSSANLLSRNKTKRSRTNLHSDDDLLVYLRSSHGRRLKPKLEYSPSHSPSIEPNYLQSSRTEIDTQRIHKKAKKSKKTRVRQFSATAEGSSWPLPDLFAMDSAEPNDENSPIHMKELSNTLNSPIYSDALLTQLGTRPRHNRTVGERLGVRDQAYIRRRVDRSRSKYFGSQQLGSPNVSDVLHEQHPFSANEPSIPDAHSADLLNFCVDAHPTRFRTRSDSLDELEAPDDDYMSPVDSRTASGKRMQLSNDELEEEDLLAPELSVLSGHATLTNSDGILVQGMSDGGSLLVPGIGSSTGGSRRKSPVRPMQVLRTKSINTTAATSDSSSVTAYTSKADVGSFIFTTTSAMPSNMSGSGKQSLIGDVGYGQDIRLIKTTPKTSLIVEQPQLPVDFGSENVADTTATNFRSPSVVRISGLSTCDPNQTSDRTQLITTGSQSIDGPMPPPTSSVFASSGLLPTILTQASPRQTQPSSLLSRVFLTPNVGRTSGAMPNKSIISVSHSTHTTTSVARRRPTILKRSIIADSGVNAANSGFRQIDTDCEQLQPTLNRSGGGLFHHQSSGMQIDTESQANASHSGIGEKLILNSTVATASNSGPGPTKLLQLVTATSPAVTSQSPNNLTASDKLFGRRPANYNKSSMVSTTMNLQYSDGIENRPVTSSAPTTNANTAYRYAVVRGSADGKRYLVLGNHGTFDRTNITTLPDSGHVLSNDPLYSQSSVDTGFRTAQVLPLDSYVTNLNPNATHKYEVKLATHHSTNDSVRHLVRHTNFAVSPVPTQSITSLAAT